MPKPRIATATPAQSTKVHGSPNATIADGHSKKTAEPKTLAYSTAGQIDIATHERRVEGTDGS